MDPVVSTRVRVITFAKDANPAYLILSRQSCVNNQNNISTFVVPRVPYWETHVCHDDSELSDGKYFNHNSCKEDE